MQLEPRERLAVRLLLIAARICSGYADKEAKARIDEAIQSLKSHPVKD